MLKLIIMSILLLLISCDVEKYIGADLGVPDSLQIISISGKVSDTETFAPIVNADVSLSFYQRDTNEKGEWGIRYLYSKRENRNIALHFNVLAYGYRSYSDSIFIEPNDFSINTELLNIEPHILNQAVVIFYDAEEGPYYYFQAIVRDNETMDDPIAVNFVIPKSGDMLASYGLGLKYQESKTRYYASDTLALIPLPVDPDPTVSYRVEAIDSHGFADTTHVRFEKGVGDAPIF
jgi:hypothetical protein